MAPRTELRRRSWSVALDSAVLIACTPSEFLVVASLEAWKGGARVFRRDGDERVARIGL